MISFGGAKGGIGKKPNKIKPFKATVNSLLETDWKFLAQEVCHCVTFSCNETLPLVYYIP